MLEIGKYNQLRVSKTVDFGLYLTDGETEILLPRKYVPLGAKVGDTIEVFVYTDSEDRPIATTHFPRAIVGNIAKLRCVAATRLGAFLDWGLEKDLFVPFAHQHSHMRAGSDYVVALLFDRTSGRVIASNDFEKLLTADPSGLQPGQQVDLWIYDTSPIGYLAVIDLKYVGIVYADEAHRPLAVGDRLPGYVVKVRPDGRVDTRLRQPGRTGVLAQKDTVWNALMENNGFLPYSAKTSPVEIERRFQMSKRMFKEIVSALYKERKITVSDDGIRLSDTAQEPTAPKQSGVRPRP